MKTVVQRVSEARVRVQDEIVGEIGAGVVVLVGVERGDTECDVDVCSRKLVSLRMFPRKTPPEVPATARPVRSIDRSLGEIGGAALIVSQFTLAGTVRKGRRPSFDGAEDPGRATELYERFCDVVRTEGIDVQTGRVGGST